LLPSAQGFGQTELTEVEGQGRQSHVVELLVRGVVVIFGIHEFFSRCIEAAAHEREIPAQVHARFHFATDHVAFAATGQVIAAQSRAGHANITAELVIIEQGGLVVIPAELPLAALIFPKAHFSGIIEAAIEGVALDVTVG